MHANRSARRFRPSGITLLEEASGALVDSWLPAQIAEHGPQAVAPIDDGWAPEEMTQQLLLAAPELPDVHLQVQTAEGPWAWRGRLSETGCASDTLKVRAGRTMLEIDTARVIAVSYCADPASSGICLYDEDGELLKLWSGQTGAFDAWLARAAAGGTDRTQNETFP